MKRFIVIIIEGHAEIINLRQKDNTASTQNHNHDIKGFRKMFWQTKILKCGKGKDLL